MIGKVVVGRYAVAGNLTPILRYLKGIVTLEFGNEHSFGASVEAAGDQRTTKTVPLGRLRILDRASPHLAQDENGTPASENVSVSFRSAVLASAGVPTWEGPARAVRRSCCKVRSTEVCF